MGRIEDVTLRARGSGAERATGATTGHLGAQVPTDTREAVRGDYSPTPGMEPDNRHEYFKRLDPLVDRFISNLHDLMVHIIGERRGLEGVIQDNNEQIDHLTAANDELTEDRRTLLRQLHNKEIT